MTAAPPWRDEPRSVYAILDAAPSAVIGVNAAGTIDYVNTNALAIFDHRCEVVHTATWTRHSHLNWMFFTCLGSDFLLAAVRTALKAGATAAQIDELIRTFAPFQTWISLGTWMSSISGFSAQARAARFLEPSSVLPASA